ncbi:hypothetical protein ACFPRL_13720 [Pseudoclavibacter helvolus]
MWAQEPRARETARLSTSPTEERTWQRPRPPRPSASASSASGGWAACTAARTQRCTTATRNSASAPGS